MILFTNGCSWTWGGGLEPHFKFNDIINDEQRLKLVWPHHLGNLLNADKVINLSAGCGSNQRVFRTTLDWFLNEYKNEPMMAIIQLTDPSRYEYYLTDNVDDFTNDQLNWVKLTSSAHILNIKDVKPHDDVFKKQELEIKRERDSRMTTYTLIEGMYKTINHCASLAHLFKKYNVEYYFWGGYFKFKPDYPIKQKNYLSQINYLDFKWDWVESVSEIDAHPSVLGHKQIADLIYQNIRPTQGSAL